MIVEIKVPSPGESITEVEIARWIVADGDYVEKDAELCEIDSDKATLTVNAEEAGTVKILKGDGEKVNVGEAICTIDTDAAAPEGAKKEEAAPAKEEKAAVSEKPAAKAEIKAAPVKEAPAEKGYANGVPSPSAKKLMDENKVPAKQVEASGRGGRITKGDVLKAMTSGFTGEEVENSRDIKREKMTSLRRKLAQRLVSVKQETAMLTTFNEVDMSGIMNIRKQYKEKFAEKHGVNVGFMSFFTKAVTIALQDFPQVNSQIDGEEIVSFNYADIGVAVSTPKGLMVPVLRNAENMSLAEIEAGIGAMAKKARDGKITVDDMTGGTFTITNGGVFGSMLSTPILNPPQSAILGMHNVVERPVAINGKVEIRPIMYVALSYDHRIIDGRESVGFLVRVKQLLEDPTQMLFGSKKPVEILLGL
jgi:2-oxoglutarate dehydrogenase E2 component (dihydrolipoamide succinyltransferase)